ncbi:hypothetical protein DENSPDRAFT_877532 [Dentipellis sp. KUC8613]|nr:hypothetical protein DENSPDRAFT_877532 [Dentipellis sp. KUC8613]
MDAFKKLNDVVQDTTKNLVRDSQQAANGIANATIGNPPFGGASHPPSVSDVSDHKTSNSVPADPVQVANNVFDQINATLGNVTPQLGRSADALANNFSSAPPFGAPPIPRLPSDTRIPRISTLFNTSLPIRRRFEDFWNEIREFVIRIFYSLLPISWGMTFANFLISLGTRLFFLPFIFGVRIYESRIRLVAPWLPSFVGIANALFPMGLPRIPSIGDVLNGIVQAGQKPLPNLPLPPDLFKDN